MELYTWAQICTLIAYWLLVVDMRKNVSFWNKRQFVRSCAAIGFCIVLFMYIIFLRIEARNV